MSWRLRRCGKVWRCWRDDKVVEGRDAVGLRPQANLPGRAEGRVLDIKQVPVIQTHGEEVAMKADTQSGPG